jgi:16S rRNA (guanine527-N7)-methyltransferase
VILTTDQESVLRKFAESVVNSPAHLHLTSDRDLQRFWERHVEDGLRLHDIIPKKTVKANLRVLDLGSGNGVPGIPLGILEPGWTICALDSDLKKCGFIDTFCKHNLITNVSVLAGRAEDLAHADIRGSYDVVFARALAKLPVTVELAGAFVAKGGLLIVPHGTSWETDLKKTMKAISALGLAFLRSESYTLGKINYFALLFSKENDTPPSYPRRAGMPQKRPL